MRLALISVGQHLDQELGVHLEHLTFYVHVVVQVVVSLLSKLDLLKVALDANVADIHILQAEVLLKAVRALVGDVSECIQQLLRPVLEERYLWHECLSKISQQLLQRFALLDFKEVLVIFDVGHIVEAKITWAVLGKQQLFGSSDLIEELRQ